MARVRPMLPLVAVLSLVACGGDDAADTTAGAEPLAGAAVVQVPIQTVRAVEIGRTRDGYLITAHGTAAGLGYARPTLRPRRGGAPGPDGYVEYDFVAIEPVAGFQLPPGTSQTRQLRADLAVPAGTLRGAAGIRVLGSSGGAQFDFAQAPPPPA